MKCDATIGYLLQDAFDGCDAFRYRIVCSYTKPGSSDLEWSVAVRWSNVTDVLRHFNRWVDAEARGSKGIFVQSAILIDMLEKTFRSLEHVLPTKRVWIDE